MRFGIDLDGVLADFGEKVVTIGNQLWPGKFPPGYVPDNWDYEGHLTKEEWKEVWAVIKTTPYFWEDEIPMPGVTDLREGVRPDDEIFFITARARTVGEPPSVQSILWLHEQGLWPRAGYSHVIAVEDPKHKQDLFRALKLQFMLDDYAPTVEQLNQIEGMHVFLFDRPWNHYAAELPRVFSVSEYLNTIRKL